MGWADNYIKQLQEGKTIQFRPRGNSMTGKVNDGQLVTVEPRVRAGHPEDKTLYPNQGSVVLCKVNGKQYLHLALSFDAVNGYVQIGNNKGRVNGWTKVENIYGVVIKVED